MKKALQLLAVLAFTLPLSLSAAPLAVGAAAPADLKAQDHTGKEVDLGAAFKQGLTLVYFYPKAMTGGCTKQSCNLRDAKADLDAKGIKVYGVSTDTVELQKQFVDKESLNFPLIADPEKKVANAFGVPLSDKGFAARQTFLIKDGKVVWHQEKASPATQAQDALAAVAELK